MTQNSNSKIAKKFCVSPFCYSFEFYEFCPSVKYIQGFLGVAETSNNGPKLRKEPLRAQTWLAQNFTLRSVFPSSLGRKRLLLLLFWKEELWPFHRCDEKIPGERRTLSHLFLNFLPF